MWADQLAETLCREPQSPTVVPGANLVHLTYGEEPHMQVGGSGVFPSAQQLWALLAGDQGSSMGKVWGRGERCTLEPAGGHCEWKSVVHPLPDIYIAQTCPPRHADLILVSQQPLQVSVSKSGC